MTTTDHLNIAFQREVWMGSSGPVPLSDMTADAAGKMLEWARANAAELLRRHRGAMDLTAFRLAERNPTQWWLSTPLCDALTEIADPEEWAARKAATMASPSAETPAKGEPADGKPVFGPDAAAALQAQVADLTAALSTERQKAAVAERRAEEAAAREALAREQASVTAGDTDEMNRLRDELAAAREQVSASVDTRDELHMLRNELSAAREDAESAQQAADAAQRAADAAQAALEQANSAAAQIVPYDSTELDETRHELDAANHELDQQRLHNERLAEQVAMFEADQARHQSIQGLTRIVNAGTTVVMLAVAVLVCAGSAATAHQIAGWPWWSAVIVPIVVEGGAVVELAALVRNRRLGLPSHWTAKILATGLLALSLIGLALHARSLSNHWWSLTLGLSLPLIMVGTARAALGGDHHTKGPRK